MLRRLTRPLLLALAAVFLFEAWLWDKLTTFGLWLRDVLPFESFKSWLAARIERMPPWGALLLFAIPFVIVQPLKLLTLWLLLHGHVFLGVLGFVAIKIVGFGAIALLFELTRDKLMTFGWFVRTYTFAIVVRKKASDFVAPYTVALKKQMTKLRNAALAMLGLKGDRRSLIARIRARIRR
jgi:hypothetical protein